MNAVAEGHVFISYVREDKEAVDRLQGVLEAAGVRVWRDVDDLWPGDDWRLKIREAITAGALAFVACFSEASNARQQTYQREELLLAVEQMRLRNPALPWLLPVRLDDCALPHYDVGAGRTLDSFNRIDLFGAGESVGIARLVAGVMRILGETAPVARPAPRPATFVKSALLDPAREIELDDYVMDLANRLAHTLADVDVFPLTAPPLDEVAGARFRAAQISRYVEVAEPLLRALIPGCTWGREAHNPLWRRAVERAVNAAPPRASGETLLVEARRLIAPVLLYGAGIAALHRENYGAIRAIAVDAQVRWEQKRVPLAGVAHPYVPFAYDQRVPQIVALLDRSPDATDDDVQEVLAGRGRQLYTPVSDYLHSRLSPLLSAFIPDGEDYTATFDRFEVLMGAIVADVETQSAATGTYVHGPWFGSFTWRDRFTDSKLEQRLLDELHAQGADAVPLRAGLFGGDLERATAAFSSFIEDAARARRSRF